MYKKICILIAILAIAAQFVSAAPLTPTITSPSGSGATYNTKPWVIFVVQDNSEGVNEVVCRIFNNVLCRYPDDMIYDRYNSSYPAEFTGIGTGTTPGVATTIRHRVQLALSPGTYYLQVFAMNKGPTGRAWAGSATKTFVVGSAPAGVTDAITAGVTRIKASHFNDLRTAINNLRSFRGNSAFTYDASWGTALDSADRISIKNLNNLRDALETPYNSATGTNPAYTAPDPMTSGTIIKRIHIQEIRDKIYLP